MRSRSKGVPLSKASDGLQGRVVKDMSHDSIAVRQLLKFDKGGKVFKN